MDVDSELGSVDGLSNNDLSPDSDMSIEPMGDRSAQVKDFVYVVWEGRQRGLFWSWGDAAKSVSFYSGARHKKYHGVDAARLAFYLDDPGETKRDGAGGKNDPQRKTSGASRSRQQTGFPPRASARSNTRSTDTTSYYSQSPGLCEPFPPPSARWFSSQASESRRSSPPSASTCCPPTPTHRPPTPPSPNARRQSPARPEPAPSVSIPSRESTPSRTPLRRQSRAESTPRRSGAAPLASSSTTTYRENPPIVEVSSSSEAEGDRVYVVVRGLRPGVYADRDEAHMCMGPSSDGRICIANDLPSANATFVRFYMRGRVTRISS